MDSETWIFKGAFVRPAHAVVRDPMSLYNLTSKVEEELGSAHVDPELEDRRQELIAERVDELLETKTWLNVKFDTDVSI